MESYNTNISASVPAAVPQQQAQVKVELKLEAGMQVLCIKDSAEEFKKNEWYTLEAYEVGLTVYGTTRKVWGLIEGDDLDRIYFDLHHPRFPESSDAKEEKPNDGWISVSDRLPEYGKWVLGYSPEWVHDDYNPDGIRQCFYNGDEKFYSPRWNNTSDFFATEDTAATHWQPLPEKPII